MPDPIEIAQQYPKTCFCGCCTGPFILILIILSLGKLSPIEYGLKRNMWTQYVDPNVYHGGRVLIGPWNTFVHFPSTVQTIEFSNRKAATNAPLSTRTLEGLELHLHVSFQYQLVREGLPSLYKLSRQGFSKLYTKLAQDVILKGAAEYTAPQWWSLRQQIGHEITHRVQQRLAMAHAQVTGLQILVVDLPDQYEDAIVATQVQKQLVLTNGFTQQAEVIRAQIDVMVSEYQKNITVTLGGAYATANLTTKKASANAAQMKLVAEACALGNVTKLLPGLKEAELVRYQKNFAYQNIQGATFLFGVKSAAAVKNTHVAAAKTEL